MAGMSLQELDGFGRRAMAGSICISRSLELKRCLRTFLPDWEWYWRCLRTPVSVRQSEANHRRRDMNLVHQAVLAT